MTETDFAHELNKLGVTRLYEIQDDPNFMTLRTYNGQVFQMKYDPEEIYLTVRPMTYDEYFFALVREKVINLSERVSNR